MLTKSLNYNPMAGLYIHIPFCSSKCVYCGFYSVANLRGKNSYLKALAQEIELRKGYLQGEKIQTLYLGGGTPSLLTLQELESILTMLETSFGLNSVEEFTMEANPEQLTPDYCRGLRSLGINRLSIGVQSLQDPVLRFMGRRHTAEETLAAIRNAAAASFDNLSIDLIYGVSERDNAHWREELKAALALPIRHLSCYALTPEENSILYKQIEHQRHAPIDDELASEQYRILLETLPASELKQYEISNFAVPGYESKHNSSYWNQTPYIGLGPAAHSFIGQSRQWNPASLQQYNRNMANGIDCEGHETLSPDDLYNETLLLGLRTCHGVDLQQILVRYGETRQKELLDIFQRKINPDLFQIKGNRLLLTEAGLWLADGIAQSAFVV